jgi:predicted RNA methylase
MAELDLSGLTPLDASGLKPVSRETPPLDAAGLKRLDVSGLKPLVDTSLTDYPVEFAKGFVEGAKNLPAASLKGAAALQQEIAVQGLQRLDEMERQRTSDMLGQSLDDPFARAAQRTRRSVLGRMTPETIAERREFLTEQANRPLTEHPLYRAGEVIEEFGKETLAPRPGFEGSWTRDIGAGFGSFGAGVATAFLNPAAAALMWVTAGSGEAVENAVKAGATPEQIRRAAVLGTVPGATDAVDAMIPMLGSTGKVMGLLKRVGWGTLKGVLAEGGQEGLQQFLQNLIARGVYDPNKDLTEDVPRSAIIGAIVGGTVGGGFAAAQRQPVAQEPGDSAARGDLAAPGQWWAPEAPPPEQRPTIPSGAIPAETILPPAADAEPAPIQPVAPTAETQPKAETQPIGNAPPEASTGRFVLEALLKDPRTAAEIRADIEQALRWQPSEQWQPVPPLLARPLVDTPDLPFEIKLIDGVLQARLKPPPGSRTAPIELTSPEDVNRGAERTIEPTPAQAEAGNYPKRHLKWQGLEIAIETEAGGTRSGMGKDGVPWSVTLAHPYGYIKRTEGKDGDQIDVYVGPNPDSDRVFIIDQIDPDTRRFDEHKLVIGAETAEQAEAIYLSGFSDGSGAHRLGAMSELSVAELKTWLAEGNNRRPFAYVAPKRPPQRRAPLSLFEFLASRGGIREYRGELATLGLDRVFVPGFGRLVRPSGMPLDRAREAAVEAGYLFDPGWNTDQPSRSTINDLLNLLDQEARGTKVYSANDQEALAERAAKEAKRVAAEHLDLARYRVGEAVAHLGIKNFTDEEERAAVELVLRGADPVDAVVEVVERSAIANEDAVLSSPQETEHADDAGRADTQGAESAAAGEQQTPAVPSPAPRAAPQRLQPPGAESGGGQAQETGAAAEPAGPQRREVKPQPAAPRSAFADMATRIENARRSFINTLVELAGISEAEAAAVTDFYLKKNMAKLDAVGGRITVKHGSYLDPDAIRRALKEAIEQRPSAKPAAPAAQETTAGPSGKRWTAIGKNKDGHTLYEDENGVRSYVENGIRHVEPVPITPTRAGITVIKPEHREPWRLASEIETPQAAEPAAPAKQVEKQEPPSLPAKLAELGGALAGWLKAGRSLTSRVLQEQAEKVLGARLAEGKFDRKDIADALGLAVNIMVRDNAQLRIDGAPNAESALSQLDQLLKRLPTQRVRSEEQEALQQFSTPPHYAAAAVYAANLKDGDVVLEPSAGTGSLVAAAMAPKVEIIANEISPRRIALLRRLIGERGRIFTENAEQIDNILPDDVRPTVVLMNPPFSRAGARMGEHKVPMLAAEHVQAALKRLQPGGRLVAIVNGGFTMGGRYRAWWDQIGKDHTVVANIGVAGRVYEKYGTAFPTRLLVIDKVPPNEGHRPLLAEAQTVDELLRILEPIRNARATAPAAQPQADQPSGARPSAGGEGGRGAGLPAPAQSSLLGPGERGGGRLAGTGTPRAGATGAPAVRVEAGERPALDVLQPERPGRPERAGERPVGGDQPRIEPAQRGGDGAQRDLEPAGGRQPGAATSGERIALEVAAPTKQTGDLSEAVYQPYKPQRLRQRRKLERDLTDIVHSVVGSHAQVRFVDRLPVTKPPQGWGSYGAKVETSGGSYLPGERLITIAVADPAYWDPDSTAYHEAFHVVEHLLLNEAEMTILRRAEPRLREIARAFARLSQREAGELAGYEVRAVAFQAYAAARINGEPLGRFPASVRAVFEKLRLLFERIANYLRGLGYRTAEDVFADVFAGRMATRPAREEPRRFSPTAATAYSLANGEFQFPLEQFWQEQFGHGLDTLTQGEAGHLLKAPSLDSIRDRLAQGRRGGGVETAAGAASPRGGQEGGQIIPPKPEDDSGPSGAASDSGALFSLRQPETARERQAAMQGFLARGQPLDRALRIPFDIFGGVTRDGEWRPGARLFDRAARIIADAKFSPEGRFAFLNPYLEAARAGLIDHYGLDPDYVQRDRARALHERALMLRGAEFIKTLAAHNVGPAEARVLQAVLTGEQVSDAEMRALAEPIRAAIDQLGQEAVALGLVSAESFERNRGTYLHRVYMKYEAEQNGLLRTVNRIMGARRKKIIGEQFRGRGLFQEIEVARLMRDVPDWHEGARGKPQKGEKFIRLDEMPEQQSLALDDKSARERPLRTVWWPADQPIPPRYDDFRNEGVWEIRGEKGGKLVLWRDFTKAEREKMGEILDARYTIAKTFLLMAHDLATGRFYKDIAENEAWTRSAPPNERWVDAAEWAAQRQRYWKHGDIAWVKVPDSEIPNSGGKKQWGALAGKWVREEIWRDLNELQLMHRQHLWRALMTQWKLNKTARSPVVHMNNVVSNALLMDLLDVRWQDLARGIRSYLARDRYYQEAFEHGAFGADMMTQEIRDHVLKPLLRSNTFQQSGHLGVLGQMSKFVELLWSKAMAIDQKMIDIYRIEDELFRMATYIRRRELGDTAQQAADHAREQFIDYDIRAPWVNIARNTVLPFLAYTYRAAPLVARAVATKPWKLAKYFALAYGANAFAYWLTGGDEDKERRVLPEREQGFTWIGAPRMLRMPLNDAYGNPLFLDIRRWIPASDIFDMPDADILPAWLTPGGPLIIGGELFLNRSAFTGKEIRNDKTQDWWERRTSEADHLWKSWMPSAAWVPGSWYWEKIANAVQGATDRQGRPYSIPLAAASSVGIKLKPHDVEDAYARRGAEFASIERALESEARRLAAQHARKMISDAEFNRQMLRLMQKFERLSNRARETLQ